MGHLINERIFVSDLTHDEIADCRSRAFWLANRHFSSTSIESFDLGNFIGGYMTAEITTCYVPGQRRIVYFMDKHIIHTERCNAGQGARKQAESYYAYQVKLQQERSHARRVGVTA